MQGVPALIYGVHSHTVPKGITDAYHKHECFGCARSGCNDRILHVLIFLGPSSVNLEPFSS